LAGTPGLDWSQVEVFVSDERWVPVDSPESNEGEARRILLDAAEPKTIHSLRDAGSTIDTAADAYDALLRVHDPVDFVHLGLGPDGHTASLFPGSPALDEGERLVVATGDDLHPHPRLTWTFPGIAKAKLVVVTVMGAAKRPALEAIRAGEALPGAFIDAERVVWLADSAAGAT
jgi:6-phosphogluconolactonase